MCMCLARGGVGGVGGEWVTGLGLGFNNSGGTWGKWDMCLCFGDMLEMSVVVGGVCDMYMYLARGRLEGVGSG